MKLLFHGGAREVGRSCVEVRNSETDQRVLLDCGLKITPDGTQYPSEIDNVSSIGVVFISHAHLDHTGALPYFDHKGMQCPILMTNGTKLLTKLLLKDAFKIGKITHHHLGYEKADIYKVVSCIKNTLVDRVGEINGIKYEFFDAGHIPGSTSIFLDYYGHKILYTGDIKTTDTKLLSAGETNFPQIDTLICESTYGDRDHDPRKTQESKFISAIHETLNRGGNVLIPVFAVGRAQEILMLIEKENFNVPIFVDGMSVEATKLILADPTTLRDSKTLRNSFKHAKHIKHRRDRDQVLRQQSIIITTSGMLTGGPAMFYLKHIHLHSKDSILLTGYQGEQTNGRMLIENKCVYVDGFKYNVKCEFQKFDFSAHDGMSEIKKLVRDIKPKQVIFMHGDEHSVLNLAEWADAIGIKSYAPGIGDEIDIE